MIAISNLAKSFGDHLLFQNVSLQLNPGGRYGLVGANGSGKTTLLRIIAGDESASGGVVAVPSRAELGVLRQDQFLYEDEEILGVVMRGNPELWSAIVAKEKLLANAAEHFDADRYGRLEETIERHDGYTAEARAAEILAGLGIPTEVHRRPMSTLSGGFKLRVLLAQALAGAPDALLLDEPTNHLDIISIRWLEKFLRQFAGPVLVISHDHRFLDNVATKILDVDYQTVTIYHGNYSAFVTAKAQERARREREIEQREKEIAHHEKFVQRFKAKASKARQAQSKLRLIEKKTEALEPLPQSSRRYPTFRFHQQRPSGRDVLRVKGIRKSYGQNLVLPGVSLEVRRGDRLAIIGPNGIGKSTLLKIIVGEVAPDAGLIEWGHETHFGYFAQDHHEQLEGDTLTAEQWLRGQAPNLNTTQLRGAMGAVLFSGDEAEKPLGALSGGEAARLNFCRMSVSRPNVLVLDEPTNHLDLEAIEALVDGLTDYEGTLILVSHDRWFVGRLADRIVEITPAGITDYPGTYEEYVHSLGDDHLDADTVLERARTRKKQGRKAPAAKPTSTAASTALLQKQQDELTARIEETEARIAEIDAAFADPELYQTERTEQVQLLERERAALHLGLEQLMAEWERVGGALESANRAGRS